MNRRMPIPAPHAVSRNNDTPRAAPDYLSPKADIPSPTLGGTEIHALTRTPTLLPPGTMRVTGNNHPKIHRVEASIRLRVQKPHGSPVPVEGKDLQQEAAPRKGQHLAQPVRRLRPTFLVHLRRIHTPETDH